VTVDATSPLVACELHKLHAPRNLTVELHHIVPVAWQLAWQPAVAPYPGRDRDGRGMLWDARTIACCPTGHRNTHAWIVRMMHALSGSDDPLTAKLAVSPRGTQGAQAYLALCRFTQYGGRLQQLVAAHQWGIA
jgi:hypothetical protein